MFERLDKLSWLLWTYNGIDLWRDCDLRDTLEAIGDFHMGNISMAEGKVKLVDYGWGLS